MSNEATQQVETEGQSSPPTIAQAVRAWEEATAEGEAEPAAEALAEGDEQSAEEPAESSEQEEQAAEADGEVEGHESQADEPPKLDRLAELVKQSREKRAARERETEEKNAAASAKSEIEKARQELESERTRFREEMESFRRDPVSFVRKSGQDPNELLDRVLRSTKEGPDLSDKFSQLEAQNKALLERLEKFESSHTEREQAAQEEQARQSVVRAKQAFYRHVVENSSKYAVLAGEDPAAVGDWADNIARMKREAGEAVDVDEIAGIMEETLRANLERQYARIRSEKPEPGEKIKPQKRVRGETLTNAQAAQRSMEENRPLTERERVRAAEKALRDSLRASDD